MAHPQDYLKPRNKELRDLLVNLPQPVRIGNAAGEILWQNTAAERLPSEPTWESRPTTWQGKKAQLMLPAEDDSTSQPRVSELEAEVERLKRHQRQTARRKKQAEDSAKRREAVVSGVEKREEKLRVKLESSKKEVRELKKRLTQETKKAAKRAAGPTKSDLTKLQKQVDKLNRQLEKKADVEANLKESAKAVKALEREKKKLEVALDKRDAGKDKKKEELQAKVKDLEKQNKELQEWALLLEQDKSDNAPETAEELRKLKEQLELNAKLEREAEKRFQDLQDDFDEYRHKSQESELKWAERLKGTTTVEEVEIIREELTKSRELQALSEERCAEIQKEFEAFKAQAEEAEAQRELEEQLNQKVREFEELERSFEQEQSAFAEQKSELERQLSEQESEFKRLKEEASGETPELSDEDIDELKEELEDAKTDLVLATRREIRLSEKLESLQEDKDAQEETLEAVQADLEEAKEREKELRETLELYSDVRAEVDESKSTIKELKQQIKDLESKGEELEAQLSAKDSKETELPSLRLKTEATSPGLSKTLQQQLDFAKNRLRETEQKLDSTIDELKKERAQASSSKEAERLAFHDTLTGLPNRHMVARYLDYSLKQAASLDRALALFLIDLDGFRVLNETFGQDWGDQLLKAVGERLAGMRGGTHIFARHSKDRFVLLAANLEKVGAVKFVEDASKSILDALAYPFDIAGETIKLTGTIGASLGPTPGEETSLYKNAERALTSAKTRGVGSFHLFDDSLRQMVQRDVAYKRQMEHALSQDEFQPVYQPILDLNKGIVMGVEFLLRWNHRDQRVLLPADFLESAVDSGMIFAIIDNLWPKAFEALGRWRKLRKGLTLSINLSDREMLSPALFDRAQKWLKEAGVSPEAVIFEVRDSSRLRISSRWWPTLEKIRSHGFGLCLDDYGSEGSLFGTLSYVGFKQAKILVDEKKAAGVTAAPGASKGILYCAKGVQKLDKRGLKKAGFDQVQGFGVSEPLDEALLDEFLS